MHQERTEAQRAQVITVREVGLRYAKIAKRTGVPKTTCFDLVKREQDRRKEGELTPYTASATRGGRPEKLTCKKNDKGSLLPNESPKSISAFSLVVLPLRSARKLHARFQAMQVSGDAKPNETPISLLQTFKQFLLCKEHYNWTLEDWPRVIWNNEP